VGGASPSTPCSSRCQPGSTLPLTAGGYAASVRRTDSGRVDASDHLAADHVLEADLPTGADCKRHEAAHIASVPPDRNGVSELSKPITPCCAEDRA